MAARIAAAAASAADQGGGVRTAQAGAPSAARASAARAHCLSGACGLPVLRRGDLAQDRRGRDRDAGARSAPVEGDPARAREVLLPLLRGDHAAAGALASDCARARRARPARACPVRQIRPASAAQPPERGLCARRHRSRRLDAGRLGRRRGGNADAADRGDPHPCLCGRAHPCRRHDRAGAGQGQDPHRPAWTYVRDDRPFGGPDPPAAAFFYSRDRGGEHPRTASGQLRRPDAGGRLCGLQPAL